MMGFLISCDNINHKRSAHPQRVVSYNIIINIYFNYNSHITRKRWNKLMKIKNGNQEPKSNNNKQKTILYHKVAIWNKESSHMASDQEKFPVIQRAILKYEPNLVVLTKANISDKNLSNVKSEFEGYNFHTKITPGTEHARVALLVKKSTIHLKRLHELEHPDLSCMWFKMCLDDQNIMLAAWYHQWQLPMDIRHLKTDGVKGQVERF